MHIYLFYKTAHLSKKYSSKGIGWEQSWNDDKELWQVSQHPPVPVTPGPLDKTGVIIRLTTTPINNERHERHARDSARSRFRTDGRERVRAPVRIGETNREHAHECNVDRRTLCITHQPNFTRLVTKMGT